MNISEKVISTKTELLDIIKQGINILDYVKDEKDMVLFHIEWVYLHKIDIPLVYPTIQCSLFIKYIIALKFSIFLYPLALDFILCIMLLVPSNTALVNLFSK